MDTMINFVTPSSATRLSLSLVLRQLRNISATIERCYKQDFFSKISTISFNKPTLLKQTEIGVQGGRSSTTKIATLFDSDRTCETYLQPILVTKQNLFHNSFRFQFTITKSQYAKVKGQWFKKIFVTLRAWKMELRTYTSKYVVVKFVSYIFADYKYVHNCRNSRL